MGATSSAGYFQLTTLFVEYCFDLPRIAEKHKGLDILATYGADGPEMPFALSSSSRDQPLIAVGLNRIGNRSFYNRLVMVPELLSVDQARDFDVLLQSYFETDAMQSVKAVIDRVVDVCIYLRGAPSQEGFSTFMRCIARAFTGICEVELHVKSGLVRVSSLVLIVQKALNSLISFAGNGASETSQIGLLQVTKSGIGM
jgi:hypothetical protein